METSNPIRSLHDIITLNNIDDKDFSFEYDRSRGSYPYTIKAGAVARFPRFLANHAMKKLIDKILNDKHIKLNNEPARQELRERIFVSEEVFQHSPEQTEAERTKREVEELNKPSDLEKILSKHKVPETPISPSTTVIPSEEEPRKEDEKVAGLEDDKRARKEGFVAGTVDTTEKPVVSTTPKQAPTRFEVLKYAEDKLGVILDKKFMEKADKMSDKELIKELNYPL